jgi:Zn-dependent protease with chaperone function
MERWFLVAFLCWLGVVLFWVVWEIIRIRLDPNPLVWYYGRWSPLFFIRSEKLDRIMRVVEECGHQAGFEVNPLVVIGVRSWITSRKHQAIVFPLQNMVFLWLRGNDGLLDDRDIEFILAHEYGHVLDYYLGRVDHPMLSRWATLDEEKFASAVATYILQIHS